MADSNDDAGNLLATSRRLLRVAQVLWAIAFLGIAGPSCVGLAGLSSFWIGVAGSVTSVMLMAGFVVYGQSRRYENKAVLAEAFASEGTPGGGAAPAPGA
ncbi:hypothetical protein [Frondihabitans sp. PAMC 28766]|uniref:hypothetical protein n=1 Tax=Frondihabitans sp. PAMC 28766 TaxID=1795630 RepID=UPI0012FFA16B|nr:hypothetical protein [Frondihabitans sp. PAMC 28766]